MNWICESEFIINADDIGAFAASPLKWEALSKFFKLKNQQDGKSDEARSTAVKHIKK